MSRLRTLIVEDDFAVAHVTRGFVERHPHFEVVGVAPTGGDALRAVSELRPEVMLLDVYLPDMSGIDVLRRLRAAGAHVEVIAVTAARDLETVRRARAHGVHHYVVKPFPMQTLHERLDDVRRVLARDAELGDTGELDQVTVDALMRRDAVALASNRKGVSRVTLQRVAETMESHARPLSATELAEALGMSRVSARRYLERLVESGLAASSPTYGGVGRPELRYQLRG
ncbi:MULTISPECIES: response regulator [unclassified Microbacterium]|uniref:response regulator n=1 Tax=unclassified Microbacterium TaxID=2609290 RepID=UPI002C2F8A22|nr:response regulator [Microbacterium sp.]HWK78779.1 response regulator [Microbacterium sp.]